MLVFVGKKSINLNHFAALDFASVFKTSSQTRLMDEGIDKGVIFFLGCPSLAQPNECLLVHPDDAVPNPPSRGKHSASV